MSKLIDQGFIYEEEQGELLVQSESSGRAFVFKIDPCYPFGGLEAVRVVGVEPDQGNDVSLWNQKIKGLPVGRLIDLIPILE
jgi:hypothetical protein